MTTFLTSLHTVSDSRQNLPTGPQAWRALSWLLLLAVSCLTGCSAVYQPYARTIEHKMEVLSRIPRSEYRPIDLRLLGQTPPHEHLVDDGDILGVYIEGAPGQDAEQMPVRLPDDRFVQPSIGYPTPVRNGGYIRVPQIGVVHVRGMTVWQIEERLRDILTRERKEVLPDRTRIHVSLMWKRNVNVLVVRQEETSTAQRISPSNGTDADRRSGQVVELPAFQNDVLHALLQTGGLPNDQAENAVYVFKRHPQHTNCSSVCPHCLSHNSALPQNGVFGARQTPFFQPSAIQLAAFAQATGQPIGRLPGSLSPAGSAQLRPVPGGHSGLNSSAMSASPLPGMSCPCCQSPTGALTNPAQVVADQPSRHPGALRIPLTVPPGQTPLVCPQNVVLEDGDIVLVESREQDHFYTGGLLGGGQYTLPRDTDLDVIDAVLLADSYSRSTQFNSPTRAIGGVSVLNRDVTVGASRVIIERKGPDGRARRFRISLYRAIKDPAQRVIIEPGDRIYLEYTPVEALLAMVERHLLDPFLTGAPQMIADDIL